MRDGVHHLDRMATGTVSRPPRGAGQDFAGMEQQRLRAVQLFDHGPTQAGVARILGISRRASTSGITATFPYDRAISLFCEAL
jgi:hypothetical protein